MNKIIRWFFILLVAVVFTIVFYNAYNESQRTKRGYQRILNVAETAVKNYLHPPAAASPINFTSGIIFYNDGGCVIGCYIDLPNTSGKKRRTWLDVLLQRAGPGGKWTGTIIKYTPDQPIDNENLKPAPWDMFKSSKKNRSVN